MSDDETRQHQTKVTEKQLLSLLPNHIRPLFVNPPILSSEHAARFYLLMIACIKSVKPRDYFEWAWVKDIGLLNWEILRLQEFKRQIILFGQAEFVKERKSMAVPGETDELRETMSETDAISASALVYDKSRFDGYQTLERLIASAELRRDKIIRELECRREHTARQLGKASAEVIDGEFRREKIGSVSARAL
jgi:hypothetical protein